MASTRIIQKSAGMSWDAVIVGRLQLVVKRAQHGSLESLPVMGLVHTLNGAAPHRGHVLVMVVLNDDGQSARSMLPTTSRYA
jgi:hypothetical protein